MSDNLDYFTLNNEMWTAVCGGNFNLTRQLLDQGANPDICKVYSSDDEFGEPVLSKASTLGLVKIVNLLIEKGADVNLKGGVYGYSLQAAATFGNFDVVRILIECGANVNVEGGLYGSALQAAARFGHLDIVRLLIMQRANVNARGGIYGTALQAATVFGIEDTIRFLIEQGANVNAGGGRYGSALQAAVTFGSMSRVMLLIEYGADVTTQDTDSDNALLSSILSEDKDKVRDMLELGADIGAQPCTANHRSLLHEAVRCKDRAILLMLCEAGGIMHLTTQDEYGLTPLHQAVVDGRVDMVKYLLQKGASADTKDFNGVSPIQSALRRHHKDIVLELFPRTLVDLPPIRASEWRQCAYINDRSTVIMQNSPRKTITFVRISDLLKINGFKVAFDSPSPSLPNFDIVAKHPVEKRIV